MSKQSEAKEKQGFVRHCPCCGNCGNFSSEVKKIQSSYGQWSEEKNIRCKVGGFKVGKSNWCNLHTSTT